MVSGSDVSIVCINFYSRLLPCTWMNILSADTYQVHKVIKIYSKGEKMSTCTHTQAWLSPHREMLVMSRQWARRLPGREEMDVGEGRGIRTAPPALVFDGRERERAPPSCLPNL